MPTAVEPRAETMTPADPPENTGGFARTLLVAVGLSVVLFAISSAFGTGSYDVIGGFFVGPALFAITIPMLARQAKREGDSRLLTLFVIALGLKLLGAIARYVLAIDLYQGKNDALFYDHVGKLGMENFRGGDFTLPDGAGTSGTDFMGLLTGVVYTVIGPTIIGGFLFFSWLGFLGLFMFYRAFLLAVPEGRKQTYSRLIFFLPSLLFWPSSIGKESWMMFTLGVAAYGAAKLLSGKTTAGLMIAAVGLWWAALPRPHIAAVTALSILAAFIVRKPKKELGILGPMLKIFSLGLVIVASVFFVSQATSFLQSSGVDTSQGLTGALEEAADRSSGGKSTFQAPVLTSPGAAPMAIVTVLFRPTIVDAHNAQALLAAVEGTFLAVLTLVRFRWGAAAIRLIRRRPYVFTSLLMVGMLIVAFSSIGNLGILARERVQLLPFFLVLLAVPSKKWIAKREARELRKTRRPLFAQTGA
ncbi:MAG: hypothetical protein ACRDKG_04100 [Actinomycetota bacterium]